MKVGDYMEDSEIMKAVRLLKSQEALALGDHGRADDIMYRRIDFIIDDEGVVQEVRKRNSMFVSLEAPGASQIKWFGEN